MNPDIALPTMPRATGLAKKGMGAPAMRSNTNFISSGGMAEPSA